MYHLFSRIYLLLTAAVCVFVSSEKCIPDDFLFLEDAMQSLSLSEDQKILEDIRYYTPHNFMGRRVEGYNYPGCILQANAIEALLNVQKEALAMKYTLKVYDCYRPQRAVDDFINWGNNSMDVLTKNEFYPTIDKPDLFPDYIATSSGHSRGSTLDLTLVQLPIQQQEQYFPGQPLVPCIENYEKRFGDNSIDMGTGFDCMNALANTANVRPDSQQEKNRQTLMDIMNKYGFENYENEWWHFTLRDEEYPQTYFDFPIQKDCSHVQMHHTAGAYNL